MVKRYNSLILENFIKVFVNPEKLTKNVPCLLIRVLFHQAEQLVRDCPPGDVGDAAGAPKLWWDHWRLYTTSHLFFSLLVSQLSLMRILHFE